MKKLVLSLAILVTGTTVFALPKMMLPTETIQVVTNDEFKEITVDELPLAVTSAVEQDYATATISKAYVNEEGQYKLELSMDNTINTVFVDKEGNWLEEGDIKG